MTARPETEDRGESKPANNRSSARLAAVQALYQLDMNDVRVEKVVAEFNRHRLGKEIEGAVYLPADRDLFAGLVRAATQRRADIDALISERLARGWTFERMNATLRALLRAGVAELLTRPDIPARVTVNEFVDVAHGFFAGEEPGFVNKILDGVARAVRPGELA
ncbi:MAG: transcription antitermination factor NusB [Rhodospirillaceae bacterium]|nr:transcription antitermination factor NusB [Rhodospirillaceae bacterium]